MKTMILNACLQIVVILFSLSWGCLSDVVAREWTDVTGKYTIEAELMDFTDEVVRLRKANGQEIEVKLDRGENRLLIRLVDIPNANYCWAGIILRILDTEGREISASLQGR